MCDTGVMTSEVGAFGLRGREDICCSWLQQYAGGMCHVIVTSVIFGGAPSQELIGAEAMPFTAIFVTALTAFAPPTSHLSTPARQHRANNVQLGLFGLFGGPDPSKSTSVPAGFCQASHILLQGEDAAEQAASLEQRIVAGEITFAAAATEFSACPSKGKGGDLGIFNSLGRIAFLPYEDGDVAAFDSVVFDSATTVGEIVTVTTSAGTHLVKVEAR